MLKIDKKIKESIKKTNIRERKTCIHVGKKIMYFLLKSKLNNLFKSFFSLFLPKIIFLSKAKTSYPVNIQKKNFFLPDAYAKPNQNRNKALKSDSYRFVLATKN